jgi:ABC-type multidrug transport system ATPase subunit
MLPTKNSPFPLEIRLENAGKKYFRQWIFRHLDLRIEAGQKLAVRGPNGSGKSTLLQVLAGAGLLTEGKMVFSGNSGELPADEVFRHVAIAAPYLELIEEFTLEECVELHFSFKKPWNGLSAGDVISRSGLEAARHKPVRFFSSGMKQRLKLALACLSDTALLLLDEPCSNLDADAVSWYGRLVEETGKDRTVVVCSNNNKEEFFFCSSEIQLMDFKQTAPAG